MWHTQETLSFVKRSTPGKDIEEVAVQIAQPDTADGVTESDGRTAAARRQTAVR